MTQTALSFARLAIAIGAVAPLISLAADLTVVVENVKSADGMVRVGVFNKPEDFPKTPMTGQHVEAAAGSVSFVFKDLQPGNYALSALHDVNGNKKLDTSFVGMPIEPYGFSGDARGKFGPPSFSEASLAVDGKDQRIVIRLK